MLPSILQPRTPASNIPLEGAGVLSPNKVELPRPQAASSDSNRRAFGDTPAIRRLIFDNVLSAAQKIPTVSNSRHTMEVSDVHYQGPDRYSIRDRKKAILTGGSLQRRLRGTLTLKNAQTGEPIDKTTTTIAHVPYLTDGGTFVLGGNEYTLAHQMRLRPGIFARIKENGEIESHVNVLPGKGLSHRYFLDPESGQFKINIGQARMPLMPLLRAMGVTDTQLREHWGNDIYHANAQLDDPSIIDKLHKRLFKSSREASPAARRKAVADAFGKMELDSDVTRSTLGKGFKNLSPAAILAATRKLLSLNKGEADPDDRDHLAFQSFMGPEDLFAERLQRDKGLLRNLLWKSSFKGDLKSITPGIFTKHLHAAIMGSGLGLPLEEINPSDIFDQQMRVTRLGEGGIPSIDSVPDDSRSVQPSHLGFIDTVRTPECVVEDMEVMTRTGWKLWPEVTMEDELACVVNNKLEFHKPIALTAANYSGPIHYLKTEFLSFGVTPNHRMWVKKCPSGEFQIELAEETRKRAWRHFQTGGHGAYDGQALALPDVAKDIASEDWAEFMGWYLSEGSMGSRDSFGVARWVHISQSAKASPDNYERIQKLLTRLPWAFCPLKNGTGFNVNSKELAAYCKQFGYCCDKYIPDEFFNAPPQVRQRLMECLLLGDGRRSRNKKGEETRSQFCTTSKQLSLDFEKLAFSLGHSVRTVFEKDNREERYLGCHVTHIHQRHTRGVGHKFSPWTGEPYFTTEQYTGKVYCAQVPGGLLYVRRGDSLGHWSGNSFKVGIDSRMSFASRKGNDGRIYTPLWDVNSGKMVYKSPQDLSESTIAFPNQLKRGAQHVAALKGGKLKYVPRDEVQYELSDFENSFSPLANLVPMKSAVKGQRVAMGSRMYTQALPLRNAEAPLVQSGIPGQSKSFEQHFGRQMGAIFADDKPGVVESIANDEIVIKHPDGTRTTKELYNNLPYNRKTFLHNTPSVQVGQRVEPNQLLATSNYTSPDGAVALGLNPRIAFLAYKGKNYEDAIVISEDFAKRMTSEHMYQSDIEWDPNHRRGKNAFTSIFPSKYGRNILDNIDKDGVIKPGTVVNHGDPLILAATQKQLGHGSVMKARSNAFSDKSVTWEHHFPGVVTDVEPTKKGVTVAVKAYVPTQVGDKMCYSEDTEILTITGWKYVKEVTTEDKIATLVNGTTLDYLKPTAVHSYYHDDRMYSLETTQASLLVTDNHKLYAKLRGRTAFELIEAQDLHSRRYSLKRNVEHFNGVSPEFVQLEAVTVRCGRGGIGNKTIDGPNITARTYAMLLGMFLSEGNLVEQVGSGTYGFDLTQTKPESRKRMLNNLSAAGVKYTQHSNGTKVRVHSKHWLQHLKQFGTKCYNKRIPNFIFDWAREEQQALLDWLLWGDGSVSKSGTHTYTTTSKGLADDVQRLALHLGVSANIRFTPGGKTVRIQNKLCITADRYDVSIYRGKQEPTINHGHVCRQGGQRESWVRYTGNVYCVTLPHSHVLYVRRNGKPVWCGNSNRYGGKGVIAEVVPMDEMPTDANGEPFEVLLNPLGVISRTNPAQVLEMALSKIAKKNGKPEIIHDFGEIEDLTDWVQKRMDQEGLSATEEVVDPKTGRKTSGILTGHQFMMKLHHTSESKSQGRGLGSYTSEGVPAKGSDEACFIGRQSILTEMGEMSIASICEKRLGVNVKTYDYATRQWTYRPVTDWFVKRAKVEDILAVHFEQVPCLASEDQMYSSSCFYATKNHNVYSFEKGLCRVDQLKEGDHLTTWGPVASADQKALLLGTMLGDSTSHSGLVPARIKKIAPYKHDKPGVSEINVYDFTVEGTHNYLAGKALVSNSKRMAMMDTYALLSHGGIDVLRDSNLIRGQRNDEYWQTFMTGHRPPPPKVPFVYEKFVNSLKASGINVVRSGSQTQLMGLTDKDINDMAGDRAITNADTVNWKEGLKPVKGGLFDPMLTGGHDGKRWAKIKLHEPMPNPVFEEPIRRILGLTQKQFEGVLSGTEHVHGQTGAIGLKRILENINLDRAIEGARAEIAGGKKSARDSAIRKLGYLKAAQKTGVHPKDWIVSAIPVLPPAFRPVSVMKGGGGQLVSDPNYLYKEAFDANENLAQLSGMVDDVGTERLNLYNAFKAVTGLGDPTQPKNQERQVRGLLKHVFGDSPKYGMVQQKLLASSVNLVGRAVITPNPDLDMDEVGLPEPRAWSVYRPFVIRRLVRKGMKPLDAARAVADQGNVAREALLQEMDARPVLIDRAPVLHKYGIMAFKPKLTKNHTLQINPLVTKGFGADFDGDQMNYHVPADDSAVEEALYKMLPSRNLFSTANFKAHYLPNQEYIGGLYAASANKNDKRPRRFATKADAYKAIKSGDVGIDDPIEIIQH